jgi:iron complex transport system substrate-binding protein
MKKLMGLLLSAALLMGVLAGCAGTPAGNNGASTPETTPAVSDTSTPEPSENKEAAWPRAYTDSRGKEVTIEAKPLRIVSGSFSVTNALLALEVPIAHAAFDESISQWVTWKPYFDANTIEYLGEEKAVDFEKLIALEPDLIITSTGIDISVTEQYEKIAPTVAFDYSLLAGDWKTAIREIGKVIGEEQAAENIIQESLEEAKQAREAFKNIEGTVGFTRAVQKSLFALPATELSFYYDAEEGLGLTMPENWFEEQGKASLESFAEINPDYLFIAIEDQAYMEELKSNSVWNSLTAVKEGHVYLIDVSELASNPLARRSGLQTVLDALTLTK